MSQLPNFFTTKKLKKEQDLCDQFLFVTNIWFCFPTVLESFTVTIPIHSSNGGGPSFSRMNAYFKNYLVSSAQTLYDFFVLEKEEGGSSRIFIQWDSVII